MKIFENWCALQNVRPLGAAPADVAKFVSDCAEMGMAKIWPMLQEISRAHYIVGLADPTLGGLVASAICGVEYIKPPRSWPDEHKASFALLPYNLQKFLAEQHRRETVVINVAIQQAAEARKAAGLPKLTRKFYNDAAKAENGTQSHTTA